MGLPLGPLRRRSGEGTVAPEEPPAGRIRPLAGRALRALRRVLPTLALALLIITPAVAAGALAMRSGGGDEAAPAPSAALLGPTGSTGPSGPTGPLAAAPAALSGATGAPAAAAPRADAAYYRRTAARIVSASAEAGFLPLYKEAARVFGVDWRLIASVHRQETAFSSEPSTYKGLNAFGCCAGPMQFNVTNGPVSTWDLYRQSFRQGTRPAAYPHPTRKHPSIYDDFDVMMAAGALLRDGGARAGLDGGAWLAAYTYYGRDEVGVSYANQVVARALTWRRSGFAVNSADDPALIARLEDTYGVFERQKLRAAAGAREAAREREARRKARRERRERGAQRRREGAADRSSGSGSSSGADAKRPTRSGGGTSAKREARKPKPKPSSTSKPAAPATPSSTPPASGTSGEAGAAG